MPGPLAEAPLTSDAPTTSRPIGFVPRLEAFRGYGCVMVAMVHTATTLPVSDKTGRDFILYSMIFNGYAALTMFFVLSGFVLSLSLQRGPQDMRVAVPRFTLARVLRIYPPVVANIALIYGLFLLFGEQFVNMSAEHFELVPLIKNALLVVTDINGAMWSLQLEVLGVPLILFGYFANKRFGPAPLLGILAVLLVLAHWGPWTKLISPSGTLGLMYTFVFGLLIPDVGRKLVEGLTPAQARALFVTALLMMACARPVIGSHWKWSPIIEAFCGFVLIAGIAYRGDFALFRVLDWKLAHFFGKISYSFYLFHPIALMVIWLMRDTIATWISSGAPAILVALLLGIASTLAIAPLAYLSYRLFERSAINAIRLLERGKPPALAAQGAPP